MGYAMGALTVLALRFDGSGTSLMAAAAPASDASYHQTPIAAALRDAVVVFPTATPVVSPTCDTIPRLLLVDTRAMIANSAGTQLQSDAITRPFAEVWCDM